jgi:hypothetical protein
MGGTMIFHDYLTHLSYIASENWGKLVGNSNYGYLNCWGFKWTVWEAGTLWKYESNVKKKRGLTVQSITYCVKKGDRRWFKDCYLLSQASETSCRPSLLGTKEVRVRWSDWIVYRFRSPCQVSINCYRIADRNYLQKVSGSYFW